MSTTSQAASPKPLRPVLAYPALLALGALDAAGYSVIAPVLPRIAATTGSGPALIGALVATFPVGMLAGFVLAGRGVEKGRSAAVLALSLAVIGLGCLGFVIGGGLAPYFVSRLLMGLGSGGLWMGVTFSTLERWPGQEYLCMSRVFAAYSVGGLIGPGLGAIGGIRAPFAAYLVLVCVGFALVRAIGPPREPRAFRSDRSALRLPGFWLASLGILFTVVGLGMIEGVLPLHFADGLDQAEIGGLYAGTAVVASAAAALAGHLRARPMLAAATVLIVAGITLGGIAGSVPLWILALILAGAGIGVGNTGSLGVLLESVGVERIVTAMIVWSQFSIVGYLLGPAAGGGVAELLGFAWIGLVPAAAVGLLAGVFVWARGSSRRIELRAR